MMDGTTLVVIAATFLLAGTVKGVIGLGLPTVSLALLSVAIDLPSAMALLLIPSFATNLWQAFVGGKALSILHRIWPFLLMASVTVWVGATALTRIDLAILSALLGLLLVTYGTMNLSGFRMVLSASQERWAGPLIGTANGVLTGMTGSFVVPGVMFLQAIGLPRDMLIQSMGMLFTASTLALAVALGGNDLLNTELGTVSAFALVPAIAGMVVGQRVSRMLSETVFRQVFFVSLTALGAYIVIRALARLS
jgi:uncharacterized membrane protein YfcA